MASARLTAPNGTTVMVDSAKVDALTRMGFSQEKSKTTAKKASSSKKSE